MLPLELILFFPSMLVTPVVLAAVYFLRRTTLNYPRYWRIAVIGCFLLCALFFVQVLSTPLYSQRDGSPDNPGGFSASVWTVIGVFLLQSCVVIPAFPVLIGLAFLSPRSWRIRSRLIMGVFCLLYVGVLALFINRKNAAFVFDFQRARQMQRQQQGDQFQHLRVR